MADCVIKVMQPDKLHHMLETVFALTPEIPGNVYLTVLTVDPMDAYPGVMLILISQQ
ncbi:MAG: hypothetical protein KDI54_18260 [Gammaproteobacteria bacterium]|nr:hypothetical protein [Gammaproteobacteria bacterium]